ncbi:MAG TPA: alpha-amylase family protein [Bryobacteraceae bacterium]|nr:alpha-amylase family protein [Bryobacteraceae bacterium]
MTRRDFVTTAAASLGAPAVSAAMPAPVPAPSWVDKPMRWSQLVFTEDDPGRYDPKMWVDFFRRIRSDALNLSAGGYMAFYPTKIRYHYRSKFLGDRDLFGELAGEARRLGMVVVARTDPHAIHDDAAEAHPDWVHVEADGRPRRHWANPRLWVTCALGPYNFEFMTDVHREITSMYKVDGIFSNRWAGHGQCFCRHCQRNFREATGFDLPRTSDPQDPARRAYILWKEKRLFECARLWDAEMRKINPESCFIPNSGGGALSELDMATLGDMVPILFADRQGRRGLTAPWANGKNAKEYRAALGRKPIAGITSVGVEEPYRWKDSVQSSEEIRLWMIDGIAHDLRPWYIKFNAKPYDTRWFRPVEEVYRWAADNERYLRNEQPLARIAIVYSQQTARFYGAEQAGSKVEDHTRGFYQALVESRVPFEMVHDRKLERANVDRFRTLILPNIAALSDEQCRQLESFVERGGSIAATHETSLYDEWGRRRSDFGLARLFGASFAGKLEPRMQNSYLSLDDPKHPLLKGLEGVQRIINGVARVHTRSAVAGKSPITVIPTYPDLPMEDVWPREAKSNIPAVHMNLIGKGRAIFFPFDLDRTFWEVLSPDHLLLLRNAIEWATNEEPVLTVEGPGVLDVSVWRQKASMTVHLVNLTNPLMMKGPIREVYPVGPLRVSFRVPHDTRAGDVRLLVRGVKPAARVQASRVVVDVPTVRIHEVVAVELS